MQPFAPGPRANTVSTRMTGAETRIVRECASETLRILNSDRDGRISESEMSARERLFPPGSQGDSEASTEFRRFTHDRLVHEKSTDVRTLVQTLPVCDERAVVEICLNRHETDAWLKALTSLRLVLASSLSMTEESHRGNGDFLSLALYDWLTGVQQSLIDVLDNEPLTSA